ncbi:MAG: ImmA/IrrE family metallo-endopeptidase [Tatlockia sp.]|jgi:Zn-dependent peptidase ImmA (M78 family)|nr:ImmA/IrrE family metallo-endopeptidase [Tatlockia sp.]
MDYKRLASQALQKALTVRSEAAIDIVSPVCAFDVCESLKISVKFTDINMEGSYVSEPKPRILISALRPFARRNFTCGHELGHHAFGHGFNIDHLLNDREKSDYETPEEFLADSFSSFLHLPTLGVRKAFASRGWNAQIATPSQIYTVACNFGVGYSTLINHLAYSLKFITRERAKFLRKHTPQKIRKEFFGRDTPNPLIIVDENWLAKTIDIEVGTELLLPRNVLPSNNLLEPVLDSSLSNHFYAKCSGITRISSSDNCWAVFVRIAPFQFVGLSKYRHLANIEED